MLFDFNFVFVTSTRIKSISVVFYNNLYHQAFILHNLICELIINVCDSCSWHELVKDYGLKNCLAIGAPYP